MTQNQNPEVSVVQADREAAADQYRHVQSQLKKPHGADVQAQTIRHLKSGRWDKDESVQIFARHRLAHQAPPATQPGAGVGELLPCPFCGGVGDIESQPSYSQAANTYGRYRGWCDICGFGLDWHSHEADAIAAWNSRTTLHTPPPVATATVVGAGSTYHPGDDA